MNENEFDLSFSIPGNPKALKRHRSFQKGNFRGNYDPSVEDKKDFLTIANLNRPEIPFDGPLYVKMYFFFKRPKSHFRTGQFSKDMKATAPDYHSSTPDVDNLVKFVGDALNGIFWKDDSIIVKLQAMKKYSIQPRIDIKIKQIAK